MTPEQQSGDKIYDLAHATVDTRGVVRVVIRARMVEQETGEPLRTLFLHFNHVVS